MKKRMLCLLLAMLMLAALIPVTAAAASGYRNLPISAIETYGSYPVMKSPGYYEFESGYMICCQCAEYMENRLDYYEIQYRKDGGEWKTGGYIGNFDSSYTPWYPCIYIPLPEENRYGIYEFRNREVSYNAATKQITSYENAPWEKTQALWYVPLSAAAASKTAEGVLFSWSSVTGAEGYLVQLDSFDVAYYAQHHIISHDTDADNGFWNYKEWKTVAEVPATQTSYLYKTDGYEDRDYQIVSYKQNPYGNSGELVYTNFGTNCYWNYDWMPAPTDLTAESTDKGVLLTWTAPPDPPLKKYDCISCYEEQSGYIHNPQIVYQVERSEDGGDTWSQYPYRPFSGENSTLNYFLDTETYLGETYTYRVSAHQELTVLIAELSSGGVLSSEDYYYSSLSYTSPASVPVRVYCGKAAAVITEADCTVKVPADGDHPYRTAEADPDAPYTVRVVNWYKQDSTDPLTDSYKFSAGMKYDLRVEFKAKPGYVFSENTKLTINGKPALGPFNSLTYCGCQFTATVGSGWAKNDAGKWVYYKNGALAKGWLKDGGKWYYLDADGIMKTGWVKDGGKWYFLGSDGAMVTGWKQVSGKWYYMNSSGVMQTGKVQIGNYLYTFDTYGVWDGKDGVKNGWIKNSAGKWNYYKEGTLQKGWKQISGSWYYLGTDGIMVTGWKQISGVWYYMNSSGVMQTGWQKISSKWYYFNSSGAMQTGWQKISGVWYFFESSGAMKTGWYKESGKWYYFKSSGAMACSEKVTVGGKSYSFNSSGVCTNP